MTKRHVIVAGGGVAGLEAVLALCAEAFDTVEVTLLAPERQFVYRPLAVGEPFGLGEAARYELSDVAAERGFSLVRDVLDTVVPDVHRITTQGGLTLDYDALVLALGARPVVAVPGALPFRGPQDAARLAESLRKLADGRPRAVAFAAPATATWTLPLYELALLTTEWARRESLPVDVMVCTPERAPLEIFGKASSDEVALLLQRAGVRMRFGASSPRPERVDLLVALPALLGPRTAGLPCNGDGFVPVDVTGAVHGLADVYAVGDMADHSVKQGGLAAQQAGAAAATIARWAGSPVGPRAYAQVLRGVLFTGREPLLLGEPPDGEEALMWPQKIAGAYLSTYLATHGHFRTPVAA
jgi:sulfide:quinone oxidoreductase